jgi:hypothetical protein
MATHSRGRFSVCYRGASCVFKSPRRAIRLIANERCIGQLLRRVNVHFGGEPHDGYEISEVKGCFVVR